MAYRVPLALVDPANHRRADMSGLRDELFAFEPAANPNKLTSTKETA